MNRRRTAPVEPLLITRVSDVADLMLTASRYRECAWAIPLLLLMPLVGGEPSGYRGNPEQTSQADAQLRGEAPCTDANATALAHTMATELCAASLKETGEMRARVQELEHKLHWAQTELHAYTHAYEQQSNSASAPSEDRGSPLAAATACNAPAGRDTVNSQWPVSFLQQKRQRRRRRPGLLPIQPSPGASSKQHHIVRSPQACIPALAPPPAPPARRACALQPR